MLQNGEYEDWSVYEYSDPEQPEFIDCERVMRYDAGSFVIFAKTSIYNFDLSTSDGRHNNMDAEQFKNYIAKSIRQIEEEEKLEREKSSRKK